ncbi:MAG: hypothetical protein JRF43_05585 [Deltaproteobacteria bacterium]|nr:hypothetical protein [Deltaproteobacteria bacterium]
MHISLLKRLTLAPGISGRIFARLGESPEIRLSDGRFLADRAWSNFLVHLAKEA